MTKQPRYVKCTCRKCAKPPQGFTYVTRPTNKVHLDNDRIYYHDVFYTFLAEMDEDEKIQARELAYENLAKMERERDAKEREAREDKIEEQEQKQDEGEGVNGRSIAPDSFRSREEIEAESEVKTPPKENGRPEVDRIATLVPSGAQYGSPETQRYRTTTDGTHQPIHRGKDKKRCRVEEKAEDAMQDSRRQKVGERSQARSSAGSSGLMAGRRLEIDLRSKDLSQISK